MPEQQRSLVRVASKPPLQQVKQSHDDHSKAQCLKVLVIHALAITQSGGGGVIVVGDVIVLVVVVVVGDVAGVGVAGHGQH